MAIVGDDDYHPTMVSFKKDSPGKVTIENPGIAFRIQTFRIWQVDLSGC